jgi:hypothetical protein
MQNMALHFNQVIREAEMRLAALESKAKAVAFATLSPVQGFAVEGRQGCFNATWQKKAGAVDGYTLIMYSDAAATAAILRVELRNVEITSHQFPVGNGAYTRTFRIWPFFGATVGPPSAIVSATSVGYGAAEAAPAESPTPPASPEDSPPGPQGEVGEGRGKEFEVQ